MKAKIKALKGDIKAGGSVTSNGMRRPGLRLLRLGVQRFSWCIEGGELPLVHGELLQVQQNEKWRDQDQHDHAIPLEDGYAVVEVEWVKNGEEALHHWDMGAILYWVKKAFFLNSVIYKAKHKFREMKQREFTTLTLQILDLTDENMLFHFIDGLQN